MRKLTLGLLAFLTCLPSLVCMMAVCPMKSAQAGEVMSCHEQAKDGQKNVKDIMLVQDCMGVDFFQQDIPSDFSPDLTLTDIDFVSAEVSVIASFEPSTLQYIRGPPRLPDIVSDTTPVYFSTLRIRI